MTDELPGGTINFLFTDIDGSTRLLKRLGDEFALVPGRAPQLFGTLFDEHGRPARCEDGRLAGRSEKVGAVSSLASPFRNGFGADSWPGFRAIGSVGS